MDRQSKTETAQQLFERPEGATMDEVIAATGDYQYRALKRLQSRGYRIKRAKEGRATRYWAVPPNAASIDVTVAPDGKMTLPKPLRDRLGVRKGGKVRLTIDAGKVTMARAGHSILDFVGVLPKPKRAMTLEEMDDAIADAAVARFRRAVRRTRR